MYISIKWKSGQKEDCPLPLLVTLATGRLEGSPKFSVYRRPTHTDQYPQIDSHHSKEHTMGVVRTLTYNPISSSQRKCTKRGSSNTSRRYRLCHPTWHGRPLREEHYYVPFLARWIVPSLDDLTFYCMALESYNRSVG